MAHQRTSVLSSRSLGALVALVVPAALVVSTAVVAPANAQTPSSASSSVVSTIVGGPSSSVPGVTAPPTEPAPFRGVGGSDQPDEAIERQASPPAVTLATLKNRAKAEILKRQNRLNQLADRLTHAKGDCGGNALLLAQIQAAKAGLAALDATITAETDLVRAKAQYRQIFGDYRVYLLLTPKVDVALRCIHDLASIAHVRSSIDRIREKIADAAAKGADVSAANVALNTPITLLATAEAKSRAAAGSVAALAPDQFDPARLAANNAALALAKAELRAADDLIQQAKQSLGNATRLASNARPPIPTGPGTTRPSTTRPSTIPDGSKDREKAAREAEKEARDNDDDNRGNGKGNNGNGKGNGKGNKD